MHLNMEDIECPTLKLLKVFSHVAALIHINQIDNGKQKKNKLEGEKLMIYICQTVIVIYPEICTNMV